MTLSNPLDGQSLTLATDLETDSTTFRTVGRFQNTNTGSYQVGTQILGFSLDKDVDSQERAWIAIASDPTEIDADAGIYEYTFASIDDRGLDSDPGTSASRNSTASNRKRHTEGSKVGIVQSAMFYGQLRDEFLAASTTVSLFVAGETLADRDAVSIHTDDKIYKYHSTNYPNLVGISNGAYAVDETVTYIAEGGAKTGFTGLTANGLVYAENTGSVTQTSSSTTSILGRADSATQVRVKLPAGDLVAATASEITARSGTGVPNVTQAVELINGARYSANVLEPIDAEEPIAVFGFLNDASYGFIAGSTTTGVGYNTTYEKRAFPVFFDGTAITSIDVRMKKQGSPTDNIVLRLETDSSDVPSGTLFDANATGSIAAASVVDGVNTFTLTASVTPTRHTKYWLVMERDGALSTSNYYQLYMASQSYQRSQQQRYSSSAWTLDTGMKQVDISCSGFDEGVFKGGYYLPGDNVSDFIGIATENLSTGENQPIKTIGNVFDGQTGLVAYQTYRFYPTRAVQTIATAPHHLQALDSTTLMYK